MSAARPECGSLRLRSTNVGVLCLVSALVSALVRVQCVQTRVDDSVVTVPTTTDNATVHQSSRTDEQTSQPPNTSKVVLILKLLSLLHSSHNQTMGQSASESRSMSSWLRLRKPVQREENPYVMDRNALPQSADQFVGHGPPRPLLPPMMPLHNHNHNHFGKAPDPNSFFFVPSISDTTGIDYWLKFIENAKLDQRNPARGNEHTFSQRKPLSVKRVKNSRSKNKDRPERRKVIKIVKELPKAVTAGPDYDSDPGDQNDSTFDSKSTGSNKVSKQAEFDSSPRCDKFTDEICIDDFEYPEHAILEEIFKRKDIFQLMYSEVKGDAPMVDGIPRDEEENFSQDYYYNNNDNSEFEDYDGQQPTNGNQSSPMYDLVEDSEPTKLSSGKNDRGGFVCRSEVLYAKPKLARNIKGKWRVIVNAGEFTQTLRMEKCTKPNSECRFIADHKYDSRCAQISAIHRLLVFEKGKGFYIDTFRIPTACTCHVHTSKSDQSQHTSQAYSNPKKDFSKSNLGDTLWSLLDSTQDKGQNVPSNNRKQNGHFLSSLLSDQSKGGLNQLALLKLLPQLTSMAPDNVLQQLLEDFNDLNFRQQQSYGHRLPNQVTIGNSGNKVTAAELQQILSQLPRSELSKAISAKQRVSGDKTVSVPRPTTTTIVTPGGSEGAPVVQVIHLPVSSEVVTTDVDSSMDQSSFEDSGQSGTAPPSSRLRSHVSVMSSAASTRNTVKHPKYRITSTGPHYLQSPSITNSSVAPPPKPNVPNAVTQSHEANVSEKQEDLSTGAANEHKPIQEAKQANQNKKINFSYHPILEYIVQ